MRKEFRRVRKWARHAPHTFRQHEYLMKAEWARISRQDEKAGHYYDLAIETSEQGSFVRYKALTNELAARFYYNKGFKEFAAYLLRQSEYYYSVWGRRRRSGLLTNATRISSRKSTPRNLCTGARSRIIPKALI